MNDNTNDNNDNILNKGIFNHFTHKHLDKNEIGSSFRYLNSIDQQNIHKDTLAHAHLTTLIVKSLIYQMLVLLNPSALMSVYACLQVNIDIAPLNKQGKEVRKQGKP